jgi:hypothetical protein
MRNSSAPGIISGTTIGEMFTFCNSRRPGLDRSSRTGSGHRDHGERARMDVREKGTLRSLKGLPKELVLPFQQCV